MESSCKLIGYTSGSDPVQSLLATKTFVDCVGCAKSQNTCWDASSQTVLRTSLHRGTPPYGPVEQQGFKPYTNPNTISNKGLIMVVMAFKYAYT